MKNPMKYVCFTLLCLASFISIDARERKFRQKHFFVDWHLQIS